MYHELIAVPHDINQCQPEIFACIELVKIELFLFIVRRNPDFKYSVF